VEEKMKIKILILLGLLIIALIIAGYFLTERAYPLKVSYEVIRQAVR